MKDGYLIYNWLQGPNLGPTFASAESSFIFGSSDMGKSRLLVRLLLKFHIISNAQLVDAFGAENDSESTVHILNPNLRDSTMMITGDQVKVEGWDLCKPISEFSLESAKDYNVIITDRALFGPMSDKKWDYKYYAALAKIFELYKRRTGQPRLAVLGIREIWNVVYSVIRAGISRDEQAAQIEFRKLHNQRYHSKVAIVADTQRYTDEAASVRTLHDYRYIKGFGSQPVPNELHFLYKPHLFGSIPGRFRNPREWMVRNMPLDQFAILTKRNGVGMGWYSDIPWHVKKGYSPLRQMGITVNLKQREADEERKANNDFQDANYIPSNNDLHLKMKALHAEGYTYIDIAKRLSDAGIPTTDAKVKYHLTERCHCAVTVEGRGS